MKATGQVWKSGVLSILNIPNFKTGMVGETYILAAHKWQAECQGLERAW